jgi:alpha-D-xyloside xylohydrolase
LQSSKPINHRGDTLNNPTLTHSLSSPIENVLYLSSTHWTKQKSVTQGPQFELFPAGQPEQPAVQTSKGEEGLKLDAGSLSASVDTRPKSFDVSFHAQNKLLTKLGWRSVGYVKQGTTALHPRANYLDPNKGKRWVTYQLQLGVGDKVYGLGERFGPFVKNGQVRKPIHTQLHDSTMLTVNRASKSGTKTAAPVRN